mmetsp:Transcript_40431/g.120619  ORF Transcript_40431/g.120619 Transcript_40431/m.120619 type:complete len:102 (-) Transcript_40431:5982-6287(-)
MATTTSRQAQEQTNKPTGDLKQSAKSAMLARLRSGQRWFDSGDYFLGKEGKVPSDVVPGGQPTSELPPKLSPTSTRTSPTGSSTTTHAAHAGSGGPSVSDY